MALSHGAPGEAELQSLRPRTIMLHHRTASASLWAARRLLRQHACRALRQPMSADERIITDDARAGLLRLCAVFARRGPAGGACCRRATGARDAARHCQ
jgi:hypothetical protein